MQRLLSKLPSLSVNTTSHHPTATDSVRIEVEETSSTTRTENDRSATSSASSSSVESPFVTEVIIKHSSAFNSERESGMTKLEQLQFVEMLKGMILGKSRIATMYRKDYNANQSLQTKHPS
jgi:hypothetical protein